MPTPTSYVYASITATIPAGVVSLARLSREIALSAIVTQIDLNAGGIIAPGDNTLTIWFKDPLSSGDKTILDGSASQTPNTPASGGSILGDHSGVPLPDDAQEVVVTSGTVSVTSGTITANGKIRSPNDTDFLGDAANPMRTDPTGTTTQPVSGPLTDAQLRATAVPVSGPLTDAQLRAATVPVSGTVTANIGTAGTLALNSTLTGGTQKAIIRGGAKGSTTAADVTSTAQGANNQAVDVQLYHGGAAKDPTAIRALTSADVVTATGPVTDAQLRATAVPVSAASLPLPAGASTEATLALIKAKTDNLDVALSTRAVTGLTDAQLRATAVPVSAASLPLPTGAATQTTLASIDGKLGSLGQKAMSASAPMVIASDQTAVATKAAAGVEVDGHSANIGTLADADTASTLTGLLKRAKALLAGGLPAALTGAGSLKVAIVEAIVAGTNEIGKVAQGTKGAGSNAWPVVLNDSVGNAVTVTLDATTRRLEVNGKVQITGALPPPSTTPVLIFADTPLVVRTHDTEYVIPNGLTFYLQEMVSSNEDPTKGAVLELFYYNGTEHTVSRLYTNGATVTRGFPSRSTARDGTAMVGNGTHKMIARRAKFSGTNISIDSTVTGYVV